MHGIESSSGGLSRGGGRIVAGALLRVEKIDVFYHDFHALWDVSIDVDEGLVVSIIGANGAGKSTLLNTIAGVLRPSTGVIEFCGKRINICLL